MNERLPNPQVRRLKALAQKLEPIVKIGKAGVSGALLKSLDEALEQHELVKVKFTEFKEQKKDLAPLLAEKTSSRLIMQVGHVAVYYREQPDASRRRIQFPREASSAE